MFKFFWSKTKPEIKIRLQVLVFLKWRKKRGLPDSDYQEWLDRFLEFSKKTDVLDVTAIDIVAFMEHVRVNIAAGQWAERRVEIVLRQFRRFYTARGKMMKDIADYQNILHSEGVNFVSDVKRNKEIVELYLKEQRKPKAKRKWTCRSLGEEYGLHYSRIAQILRRDIPKYGHGQLIPSKLKVVPPGQVDIYLTRDENIKVLHEKGIGLTVIANHFGLTKQRVHQILYPVDNLT